MSQIKVTNKGIVTTVEVDGQQLPGVVGMSIEFRANEYPRVTLEMQPGVVFDGEGIVQVIREPSPGDVMAVTAEWLRNLDPVSVRAVLEGRPQTMRSDPVAEIMKVLADLAQSAAGD